MKTRITIAALFAVCMATLIAQQTQTPEFPRAAEPGKAAARLGRLLQVIHHRDLRHVAPPYLSDLAGQEGLEPPALGFGDRCSTN